MQMGPRGMCAIGMICGCFWPWRGRESLSGAGQVLRLDPATLGRRIARLEADLGAALFVKSPQGYALTEAGAQLLTRAEAAEQAMRGATADWWQSRRTAAWRGRSGSARRTAAPISCCRRSAPRSGGRHPGLEIQIVALPRVVNLSRREADMAIAVSAARRRPADGAEDHRLPPASGGSGRLSRRAPQLERVADLQAHRVVGYIPDMIFDRELDYLAELGADAGAAGVEFGVGAVEDAPAGRRGRHRA